MIGPRKLKDILAELATEFGVTKGQLRDVIKRTSSGLGRGWEGRLYIRRPPTPEESAKFTLPEKAAVLTIAGTRLPTFFVSVSSEKDKDQIDRPTVAAATYGLRYVASICLQGEDAHLP